MAPSRPFRFGAKGTRAKSGHQWAELARQAEDLGFASFQMDDHFGNQFSPIPALAAAACATSRISVGTVVVGVDFRNPVMFAKECATLDILSDGRFIVGIGAGWQSEDYVVSGITQDSADIRIERLDETVQVLRGLWGEGTYRFDGKHYTVGEIDSRPKPLSNIPILIGGGGRKILSLAARTADIVGVNPKIVGRGINSRSMASTATTVVDEKMAWIQAAAGERFAELELHMQIFVTRVTDRSTAEAETIAPMFGLSTEAFLEAPYFQLGTVDEITESLQAIRDRWGISYFTFLPDATLSIAPVVARLAGT